MPRNRLSAIVNPKFSVLPGLERLERRTLLALSPLALATTLNFSTRDSVQLSSEFLGTPSEVELYSTTLHAGDAIDASIVAQANGSGLASLLRVFNADGTPMALDNQEGGDPFLTFQAATTGTYYIGVSSAPNDNYNPTVPGSGTPGSTAGLYELDVTLTKDAPLMPDMAGSSFRTGLDMAAPGDTVPVDFSVENRGGANPGNFQVQVLFSTSNLFDTSTSQVLATFSRSQLVASATGESFSSPAGFSVTLPAGLTSGNDFLGLKIIADPSVPEAGLYDKSGVFRGEDWENLTVVTPGAAGTTDLSQVDSGLLTEETGTAGNGQEGTYAFTVTSDMGDGELTAEVVGSGGLSPRLTIAGPTGGTLIQSDSGRVVQALQPGTYFLTVTAQAGEGAFRLDTSFTATSPLLAPVSATPEGSGSLVAADLTNNGILDLVSASTGTIIVYIGDGDGTFEPPEIVGQFGDFTAGTGLYRASISVADLTGNGKLDLVASDLQGGTISVFMGNGDGTFQPAQTYAVGGDPLTPVLADLTGDGVPDIVVPNYDSNTVSVLLGNGNGTFQAQQVYPVGPDPRQAMVADLTGDGIPDIVTSSFASSNISVLFGNGNGSFQPQRTIADGGYSMSIAVADFRGDGRLDIVATNPYANTVSVLLSNGNGTFEPPQSYATGSYPVSVVAADVNGDGMPDIIVDNERGNTVSVLLGNGDGTFQPQLVASPGEPLGLALVVGDFNGDGKPDIAIAPPLYSSQDGVIVLLGNGDGTFQTRPGAAAAAPALGTNSVAIADLTGNGREDITTANSDDASVSVLLQNSDGTFETRQTFSTGAGTVPIQVAVADLTGDGISTLLPPTTRATV